MKRGLAFKSRKWAFRGIFFVFVFAKRILVWLFTLVKNFKREALMGAGECPKCHSLDMTYRKMKLEGTQVVYPFTCKKCHKDGEEAYSLEYIASILYEERKKVI